MRQTTAVRYAPSARESTRCARVGRLEGGAFEQRRRRSANRANRSSGQRTPGPRVRLAVYVSALLGTLTISLAIAVLVLLCVLFGVSVAVQRCRAPLISSTAIVRAGRFADRVRVTGPASPFAASANRLLEQIAMKELLISERERSLVGLLGGLHEAVAVHRENIVFANQRFAALAGAPDAAGSSAHPCRISFIPTTPTSFANTCVARSLGEPGLDRLEVELHPLNERTARVELSAVRIDYQGGRGVAAHSRRDGAARFHSPSCGARAGRRRGRRSTRSARASSQPT